MRKEILTYTAGGRNNTKSSCHIQSVKTYLHPCFHGVQFECGEGCVEVHLEGEGLGAEVREGGRVGIAGTQKQAVVAPGTFTGTL